MVRIRLVLKGSLIAGDQNKDCASQKIRFHIQTTSQHRHNTSHEHLYAKRVLQSYQQLVKKHCTLAGEACGMDTVVVHATKLDWAATAAAMNCPPAALATPEVDLVRRRLTLGAKQSPAYRNCCLATNHVLRRAVHHTRVCKRLNQN